MKLFSIALIKRIHTLMSSNRYQEETSIQGFATQIDNQQRWLPPPANVMKLNLDFAVAHQKHGGAAAAVCRDHNGVYLGSLGVVFHITDPVVLEAYACRESMALAKDLDIQNLIVASDCQGVVNDINHGSRGHHAAIIYEIIARRSSFQSCIVSFMNAETLIVRLII